MFWMVGLAAFFVFLTGCTGTVRRDMVSLEGRVFAIEGDMSGHGEQIAVLTAQQKETARLLSEAAGRIEKVEGRTEEAHTRISALQAETRQKLVALERRVTGVRAAVSSSAARLGLMEDASGLDTRIRAFKISGFKPGSSETPAGWAPTGVKAAIAEGFALKAVVGFSDSQCPREGDCEKVNRVLASERASSIATAIGGVDSSVLIEGRGSTDRFGGAEVNRSVLVYLERDNPDTYVPLRGPAGPAGQQGPQGPEGPMGPPGLVQVVTVPPGPGASPPAVAVNSGTSPSAPSTPTGNP